LAWVGGRADFADGDTDNIVEPAIGLAVGEVKHRADDLTAFRRIGAAIPVPLHHDRGAVVGFDDGPEVGPEWPGRTLLLREVRATEAPGDRTLATSLGEKEHLLPAAVEADCPALGIGETDPVQRLKPHRLLLHRPLS
jgi:hypothetical protein